MRKFFLFFLCLIFTVSSQVFAKDITPLILTVKTYPLTKEERAYIKQVNPYGFIFVTKDFKKHIDFSALKYELNRLLQRKVYFFVDQEGGPVNRLRFLFPKKKFPSAEYYGNIADNFGIKKAEKLVFKNAKKMAYYLSMISMDVNLAPTVDVRPSGYNGFFRSRIFSDDPFIVAVLAQAFANGTVAGGIEPCFKHFPGTALSQKDPHTEIPVIDHVNLDDLNQREFIPFAITANYKYVLMGHALFPQVDAENISTFSPKFYRILRENIGFKGLIITDALNMKATGNISIADKIVLSLKAGADLAMPFFDNDMPFEERLHAIEQIPPEIIKAFNEKISEQN